jgi:hypothetical protein
MIKSALQTGSEVIAYHLLVIVQIPGQDIALLFISL